MTAGIIPKLYIINLKLGVDKMQKIELFGIKPTNTLREVVEKLDLEHMFVEEGETFDANNMNMNELKILLHVISNGALNVDFTESKN